MGSTTPLLRSPLRAAVLVLAVALLAAVLLPIGSLPRARDQPLVALVILDTVRRDHIQPCGEQRPVTPNLARLAKRSTTYCGTIAPGSWTPPVHAAIFTGTLPTENGALAGGPDHRAVNGIYISPMSPELPTLAEYFDRSGYQTVLISTNPILHPAFGLTRGFSELWVAPEWYDGDAAMAAPRLREFLRSGRIDPDRPLFLVINVAIAHDEYEPVPKGVPWLASSEMEIGRFSWKGGFWIQYLRRQLRPDVEQRYIAEARRAYSWGVHRADQDLGDILDLLQRTSWLTDTSYLFVTSDHGEMLGEEHQLGHGGTVAPPVLDVFILATGPSFRAGELSTAPHQSQDLFPTLLRAAGIRQDVQRPWAVPLRRETAERITISFTETHLVLGGGDRVAVRQGATRVVLSSEGWSREEGLVANAAVPGAPQPDRRLQSIAAAHIERGPTTGRRQRAPEELEQALRAVGYIQ